MNRLRYFLLFVLTIFSMAVQAQSGAGESLMRSSGRIYVVIAVILTILAGLILYLVLLDKRLSRLEKEAGSEKG